MKRKKTIFAVFGLIVCAVWFILAVEVLPEVWTPRPVLWENVDSIKLFLYSQHWSASDTMKLVDSTAGAARTDTNRYDTNLIVDGDSAYDAVFAIWDYPDYTEWVWYWAAPKLDTVYWTAGGPGDDTVKVCAYDTVGAGDSSLVSNVKITVKDNTGEQVAALWTGASGCAKATLNQGYHNIYAFRAGWMFDPKVFTFTGNDTTICIQGLQVPLQEPDDPAMIVVQGNVTRIGGLSDVDGVQVCAYHAVETGKYPVDTVGGSKIILPLAGCATADTSGHFQINLIKSSEYIDTTMGFYTFKATFGGQPVFKIEQLYLTGNINLGDSIAAR